jgi:hypothetical protein
MVGSRDFSTEFPTGFEQTIELNRLNQLDFPIFDPIVRIAIHILFIALFFTLLENDKSISVIPNLSSSNTNFDYLRTVRVCRHDIAFRTQKSVNLVCQ